MTVAVTGSGATIDDAKTDAIRQALQRTMKQFVVVDRVCRSRGVSRDEAVEDAVRWYIDREGDLPFADDLQEDIEA